MTSHPHRRRLLWLASYAIAMGLLESAVVVYLRELYYPNGFRFPLVSLPPGLALVEIVREACTLAMLLAVAALAADDRHDGFFVFGFLFGVWDLVYYAGLWAVLGWPESLWTWDVLFLIPVPWVAPVLAPVLISLLLVGGFAAHTWARGRNASIRLRPPEWALAIVGAIGVVVSFCWRFRAALTEASLPNFAWPLFTIAVLAGLAPFARALRRAMASATTRGPTGFR